MLRWGRLPNNQPKTANAPPDSQNLKRRQQDLILVTSILPLPRPPSSPSRIPS